MEWIRERLKGVKLLVLDCDGVLTNGFIYLDGVGQEFKGFNVKDGLGLKLLSRNGIKTAIVSARHSMALEKRAEELGISYLKMGVDDKEKAILDLKEQARLEEEEICSVGDDIPDLGLFKHSVVKIAVRDAAKIVKEKADYVTKKKGGMGAVREVCDLILEAKGLLPV